MKTKYIYGFLVKPLAWFDHCQVRLTCALLFSFVLFLSEGCKKFIDVKPPVTSVTSASVYTTDPTAISVLTGVYAKISNSGFTVTGDLNSLSYFASLSADELMLFGASTSAAPYYLNTLSVTNINPYQTYWSSAYQQIYVLNSAIEGINASNSLTPAVKTQLLGEAQFMRAFYYFYLTNLYGDVPLITSTNYSSNATLPRTPQKQVYDQIITDLKSAQQNLSSNFLNGTLLTTTSERTGPTKWAATALLARAYLFNKAFDLAEAQASVVISNNSLFSLPSPASAFLKNNNEAIWQLQPTIFGYNSSDAVTFVIPTGGPVVGVQNVYLNSQVISAFEPNDQRKANWIDSVVVGPQIYYYPYKYKVNTIPSNVSEYTTVLRLAEQYLIRAEARGQQNNLVGAIGDLNVIRTRAGLPSLSPTLTKDRVLAAIMQERRVELFTEWSHRWLDLKRTGTVDAVMTLACPVKGTIWNSYQQLYPIPQSEILTNSKLIQNPGY